MQHSTSPVIANTSPPLQEVITIHASKNAQQSALLYGVFWAIGLIWVIYVACTTSVVNPAGVPLAIGVILLRAYGDLRPYRSFVVIRGATLTYRTLFHTKSVQLNSLTKAHSLSFPRTQGNVGSLNLVDSSSSHLVLDLYDFSTSDRNILADVLDPYITPPSVDTNFEGTLHYTPPPPFSLPSLKDMAVQPFIRIILPAIAITAVIFAIAYSTN